MKKIERRKLICAQCGGEFVERWPGKKFCSRGCAVRFAPRKAGSRGGRVGRPKLPRENRICPACGVEFTPSHPSSKKVCCSRACHNSWIHNQELTGQKFGKWTVIARSSAKRRATWECRCDCGNRGFIAQRALLGGASTQCVSCSYGHRDLTGMQFGLWKVLSQAPESKTQLSLWTCQCRCGYITQHNMTALIKGYSTGCRNCVKGGAKKLRPFEAAYRKVIRLSMKAGYESDLTYEEYVTVVSTGFCHYCWGAVNVPKHKEEFDGSSPHRGSGLDRKDNSRGYVSGNVVLCCLRCNIAKGARFTHDEWFEAMKFLRVQNSRIHLLTPEESKRVEALVS